MGVFPSKLNVKETPCIISFLFKPEIEGHENSKFGFVAYFYQIRKKYFQSRVYSERPDSTNIGMLQVLNMQNVGHTQS